VEKKIEGETGSEKGVRSQGTGGSMAMRGLMPWVRGSGVSFGEGRGGARERGAIASLGKAKGCENHKERRKKGSRTEEAGQMKDRKKNARESFGKRRRGEGDDGKGGKSKRKTKGGPR